MIQTHDDSFYKGRSWVQVPPNPFSGRCCHPGALLELSWGSRAGCWELSRRHPGPRWRPPLPLPRRRPPGARRPPFLRLITPSRSLSIAVLPSPPAPRARGGHLAGGLRAVARARARARFRPRPRVGARLPTCEACALSVRCQTTSMGGVCAECVSLPFTSDL